jgi:hypothetical protein
MPVSRGFTGAAGPHPEYEAAWLLREQIRLSFLAWFTKALPDCISGESDLSAAVNPIIESAPAPVDARSWLESRSKTNLILLGGPVYNAAASYYQEYEGAHFALMRQADDLGWCVWSLRAEESTGPAIIASRAPGEELVFVQRIIRKDTGARITMCSGTGAGATLAGAEWLSRNYRDLDRHSRNGEFGILLEFTGVTDPQNRFSGEIYTTERCRMFDGSTTYQKK